jgi:cell division protease FtsH
MLGGRAAEEIIFGDFTTGAGNDLHRTTQIARRMICEFGMSEVLGPRTFGDSSSPVFLGRDYGSIDRDYSDSTATLIDQEIKKIVDEAHQRASRMLADNREALVRVAEALIERETIDATELDLLMRGEELPPIESTPPPAPPAPEATVEEKKRRDSRIFGKSILDRPKEATS